MKCKFAEIRKKVDDRLYKKDSTAEQRDEACRFAEAAYHNSRIDDILNWNAPDACHKAKNKLLYEIERSALCLIIERDKR